jgi:hypothetical protein
MIHERFLYIDKFTEILTIMVVKSMPKDDFSRLSAIPPANEVAPLWTVQAAFRAQAAASRLPGC